jgi:hypothetical protein
MTVCQHVVVVGKKYQWERRKISRVKAQNAKPVRGME